MDLLRGDLRQGVEYQRGTMGNSSCHQEISDELWAQVADTGGHPVVLSLMPIKKASQERLLTPPAVYERIDVHEIVL